MIVRIDKQQNQHSDLEDNIGLSLVKPRNKGIQNGVQVITNTSNRNVISDKKAGLFVHEMH